ncbi:MAG: DUF4833 domain-containing protein [Aestuariivirga sp.]|uniref:DUF4833 domain-containing protein n=1 Tax=Aestuariivirga sp. TaxID=2650926 RepID=UPI0025C43B5A|nr:DUF4833 domain-containing protein [Aestuariivirga sp.]MCA3561684.1 DUF4833 domain-containing protein [Aestuariivirga sp.]
MKRAAAALLLLASALMPAAAGDSYPVPREPNQVFYVQRSMNSNTIVYVARLAGGKLDPRQPVEAFWRRFNDEGEKKDLSTIERNFAFGVKSEPAQGMPGSFLVRVVSYQNRPALLKLVDGVPRLEAKVAGEPSVLGYAYLHLDESGSVPSVSKVDLYGYSLATGKPVMESFIP